MTYTPTHSHHTLIHAPILAHTDAATLDTKTGLERTRKFLGSIGRYGNTPYLACCYGVAEIAQSFCRSVCVGVCLSFLLLRVHADDL